MYLTAADLKTHLYTNILAEITRADATITDAAIDAGIAEAKSYLGRYDLDALFGTGTTAPTVADLNLQNKVKDLAVWQLLRLANPNINLELYKAAYDDAVEWLTKVTRGTVAPAGWPYAPVPTTPAPDGDSITWTSNPKRRNHY